ncbi:MAG TPA: haloacid dehalogenase [Deltaproteobacteria bacterium]|nr:haloacid dehalogenase [Deltaproteobacteria bacterium]HPX19139.1 haloacid dehalogenase [Deltaproteobacteria bacterium]
MIQNNRENIIERKTRNIMLKIPAKEIAFDFDGVVADTFRLFVEIARKDYHVSVEYEDITDYDFLKVIKMELDDAMQIIDTITYLPHEIDLLPNLGAMDVLSRLARISPVLLVTARPVAEPLERWFKRHAPELPAGHIRIIATGTNTAKLEILQEEGVRYFIEDRVDTCHLLAPEGITPIIYDQPWNRKDHSYLTVKNWDDISSLINWNGLE